jgi:hypothetical protein
MTIFKPNLFRICWLSLVVLFAIFAVFPVQAENMKYKSADQASNTKITNADKTPNEVEGIYDQLEDLFLRYYPNANIDRKTGQFRAQFNIRKFMIHHALKTGEWQEAQEQDGPNRKGIICGISYASGAFGGAAVVPQTFNNRYFESLLMAPYNKKLNMHLVAHLDFPDDTAHEFLSAFNKIINSFGE